MSIAEHDRRRLGGRADASARRPARPFSVTTNAGGLPGVVESAATVMRTSGSRVVSRPRTVHGGAGRGGRDRERCGREDEQPPHQEACLRNAWLWAVRSCSSWKNWVGSLTPFDDSLCRNCGLMPVDSSGPSRRLPACAVSSRVLDRLRDEDVLHRHDVGLHPQHLGDVRDAARAVDEAGDLDDQVERRRRLLADGAQRQVDAGRQHERLDAARWRRAGVFAWIVVSEPSWPVFMAWSMSTVSGPRHSPTMMRSGRIRRVFRTRSRIVTWPLPSMFAGRVSSVITCSCAQLELGRVLDGDDALAVGDRRRQHVQRRRLAGAGAAGDEDVQLAAHAGLEELARTSASACRT